MRLDLIMALALSAFVMGLWPPTCFGLEKGIEPFRVELDAFSGRENPHWNLSICEAEQFLKHIRSLNGTETEFVRVGLGYRGIIVRGADLEDYDEILIYKGIVLAQRGNNSSRFTDDGRLLELWLLNTGKDNLDRNLYSQIVSQIGEKMWIFDSHYRGCARLWGSERGLTRASTAFSPSFYMYLKDPPAHREMIEALESCFKAEDCSFRTIFGTFQGHKTMQAEK